MKFKGILKDRTKTRKIILIILSCILIIMEIAAKKYVYIPLTILLIMAALLNKQHVVSEEGVNIYYELLGKELNSLWNWDEITEIAIDYKKAEPDVMIYFKKEMSVRAFKFSQQACQGVVDLAKKMSSVSKIEDITDQ